ncbi:sugar phosphate isomerase/epimerase [Clostridium pascui]|uniref:sugar phosphate isomerase/epimerase family protein n=1 Tax=Clostridium pascui TaxID=46609 RepID=UPI001FAFD2D7|nr:sugar phosphate isomerase/epimerase family protein [Clostridium pascui]MBM7870894.1 sugar phosphate isomerase/epimerase [Clostridium pascui]
MLNPIGYAACLGEKSIYDIIDFAISSGFNAVELNMNVPMFFPENYSKEDRLNIKNYTSHKGIVLTLHAPEDISLLQLQEDIREAVINRFKTIIQFGIDIGAKNLTLHVGPSVCFTLTDRKSYMEESYENEYKNILKTNLKKIVDFAGNKIKICVENSGRFPKKVVQETVQELLDSDNLYLTWDIGHSLENKYAEIEFFVKNIDKIHTCHIHDNNGKSDHQIPGTGLIDFKWHFNLMKDKPIIYIIEVRPREKAAQSLIALQELDLIH